MPFSDVREFIAGLAGTGDLVRVAEEVDWDLEIGAISRRACELDAPALWFNIVRDYPGQSVLANPLATWRRAAVALGLAAEAPVREIYRVYEERESAPIPPVHVVSPTLQTNLRRGADVDLAELIAPMVHEGDGGRYIGTWDVVISRDPRSGWTNWGTYRFMVHDERTLTGWPRSTSHLGSVLREVYLPRGEPMPIALVIGADPLCHLAACATYGIGGEEAALAGGLRGAPVALCRAHTSDLLVPAGAEIVIEGTILPDAIAMEGPYGEYSGYRTGEMGCGVLADVTAIAFRDDPIHTLDCTGFKDDSTIVSSLTGAVAVKRRLQRHGIPVADVYLPPEGAVHTAFISVTKGGPDVVRAALEVLTARRALLSKILVVDADVDVFNVEEVIHAFSTRCHPGRGIHVAQVEGRANALTPCYSPDERSALSGATVAFDCTWPPEWDRATRIPVRASFADSYSEAMQRHVLERWRALGLPRVP
jgi:4-hydroxy-3-polyprenylbenzoate decarboxylase